MRNIKNILFALAAVLLFSCSKEEKKDVLPGKVQFAASIVNSSKLKAAVDNSAATHILVTIADLNGKELYNMEKVELFNFNGDYISKPLSLVPGNYKLTGFMVLDSKGGIIYASPKAGSEKAYLVKQPLDIKFSIIEDKVTKLVPEVLSTAELAPSAFGYFEATFNVVKTFDFLVGVFIYNESSKTFDLTNANVTVSDGTNDLYTLPLGAITNNVKVNDSISNYTLTFSKEGFEPVSKTFTNSELKKYFSDLGPLVIILNKNLIFKTSDVKDAVIGYIVPNTNYGNIAFNSVYCWTQQGELNITRSLMEFNLQAIPKNSTIKSAKLLLYQSDDLVGYGSSGENAFQIENVTSNWDELLVTWNNKPSTDNSNIVSVPTIGADVKSLEVDVTSLVKVQLSNPQSYHGFCFRLKNEAIYERFCWRSGNNSDVAKRPQLVIEF